MGEYKMEAVIVKNLTFRYPKTEYNALEGVSFSVNKGELALVSGASAAGKSTLLKLLKKEVAPFGELSGEIKTNLSAGYVSQHFEESIVTDKVRSELAFGLENMGRSYEETELACAEAAAYFNLEDKLDCEIKTLSGGEKQTLCLASVMIMKPELLILDEPCSQLDPVSAQRFISMVKKLHRDFGTTVIISEHNTEELYEYADRVILLDSGKLLVNDTPQNALEYMKKTAHPMLSSVPISLRLRGKTLRANDSITEHEDTKTAIDVKNLYFAYERKNDVLNGLTLKVYSGKINAVVGPNSSGKSTLLKTLAGVNKAYRGKIKYNGKVAMLSQNVYDLFTCETCGDEVEFGEITDYLEIGDIKNKHPYDISGGQAQRLALSMVLATGADIILLDEPTNGFDAVLKEKLGALLRDLCAKGKTVLLVSHDIEFVGSYADFVSFLSRGRIVASAPRRQFFSTLSFYTTALSRMTGGRAVALSDLEGCDET